MKNRRTILALIVTALLLNPVSIFAGSDHEHGHDHGKKEKAPHNGRLMELDKMRVEFLVEADKTASVYFYDEKLKSIMPSDQVLTLIVQDKNASKTSVDFIKKTDSFASVTPIILSEGAKAILTIKKGDKIHNLRFDLDMSICGECKNPEYACFCGH